MHRLGDDRRDQDVDMLFAALHSTDKLTSSAFFANPCFGNGPNVENCGKMTGIPRRIAAPASNDVRVLENNRSVPAAGIQDVSYFIDGDDPHTTRRFALALAAIALPILSVTGGMATIQLHDPDAVRCFDDGRAVRSLTPDQLQVVNRGEGVVATVDLANRRWPRVCVFQFIAGSPEASLAVLVDYPLRPSYLPDVRLSRVVPATTDSVVKRVAYVVHVFRSSSSVASMPCEIRPRQLRGKWKRSWRNSLGDSKCKSPSCVERSRSNRDSQIGPSATNDITA